MNNHHNDTKPNAIRLLTLCLTAVLCSLSAHAQRWDNYRNSMANQNVQLDETNLPIVFIEVDGRTIQRDSYVLGRMKIVDNGPESLNYGDTIARPDQHIDYEGWIAIKYRGNSSFTGYKNPYTFRTLETSLLPDEGGAKQKVKILGMGKDNKWIFIAPWSDKTMFRDILSFELARPWMDYVPTVKLCEVILDGYYYGVYGIGERASKGKHRLNLHDIGSDEGDLSGDIQVEIDRPDQDYYASRYRPWRNSTGTEKSGYRICYQYKSPDGDDFLAMNNYGIAEKNAVQRQINTMEAAFASDNYTDSLTGYHHYIDETSFIDYMISTEVSNNIDGYRLSTNLYKYSDTRARNEDLDPRWKMSIWDYNLAWGNANYNNGQFTDTWHYNFNSSFGDEQQVPFYWYKLMADPDFTEALHQRWKLYREGNHSDRRFQETVDSLSTLVTSHGAQQRNQQAWNIIGREVWPNPYVGRSYKEEVDYLKEWAATRMSFLDKHWLPKVKKNTTPVMTTSGMNADVIVEGLPASQYSTASIDANRAFYAKTLKSEGGLPGTRLVTSEAEGITYRLEPYSTYNAVILRQNQQSQEITFTPFATNRLYVLATSANGMSVVDFVIHYSDGTDSDIQSLEIRDFSVPNPLGTEALTALGNINTATDAYNSGTCHSAMFDLELEAEPERYITSLTVTARNTAYATLFAFAREVVQQPTSVTIVENNGPEPSAGAYYNLAGQQMPQPQPGINIIRKPDGTVRKVVVKR
ncbi:MAG: CotH kinase family protein [Prevotella sp.]|nr:CotH kinase family protein [Prevotella sp.]